MLDNRVLWRIFGPWKAELMGGCRKLHNKMFILCEGMANEPRSSMQVGENPDKLSNYKRLNSSLHGV
jgi:hypothetical protein